MSYTFIPDAGAGQIVATPDPNSQTPGDDTRIAVENALAALTSPLTYDNGKLDGVQANPNGLPAGQCRIRIDLITEQIATGDAAAAQGVLDAMAP